MKPATLSRSEKSERNLYFALGIGLFAAYFAFSLYMLYQGKPGTKTQNLLFGFSQIRFLLEDLPARIALLKLLVSVGVLYAIFAAFERHPLFAAKQPPLLFRAGAAILAIAVFFFLRNNFINSDGLSFAAKFAEAAQTPLGAYVTHDEIFEFYLHARFWFYTNQLLGWSVPQAYQVLASLAGGVFVFLLLTYAPRLSAGKPLYAFLLCAAGGYMQLFFGDVENYTLTTAWIMAYFLASALYIEKKTSIMLPSALLAIAMMFHLLAGFLLPSLLYLFYLAWGRNEKRALLYAAGIFGGIILITLASFHFMGLPISNLWYKTNATGLGGRFSMLAPLTFEYYFQIFNLVFLLLPAWMLIIPLLIYKRITRDELNTQLLIASIFMAGFVLLWHAYLGVYQDWNLFAPAMLPIALLIWRNVLRVETLQTKFSPISLFGALAFLHSYAWIFANHYFVK